MIKSKLVLSCLEVLKSLASRCQLSLIWVPGHQGIEGNEIADELAKTGASSPYLGSEPHFGLSKCNIKEFLNKWVTIEKTNHFRSLPISSTARHFLRYDEKRTKQFLSLSKSELRTITGLLTGHCRLNGHMAKMGLVSDPTCRKCLT